MSLQSGEESFTGKRRRQPIDPPAQKHYALLVRQKFHATLLTHDEGVSVSCPELPGCHSQGKDAAEALENIEDAIRGYLELYGSPEIRCEIREMEVATT
ncbi:MAG: type II toxin-antitoxin system HicB family antitoxin [Chthoniobacterales bacterium]